MGGFSGPGHHYQLISGHLPAPYLRLEHCDFAKIEASEASKLCVDTRQMSILATEDICPVSAAGICPVSTADICPV